MIVVDPVPIQTGQLRRLRPPGKYKSSRTGIVHSLPEDDERQPGEYLYGILEWGRLFDSHHTWLVMWNIRRNCLVSGKEFGDEWLEIVTEVVS